ncbi:hypothetical protein ACFY2R_16710 [Micromonospora olivasterospora]|uniref:Uncharacterized protein n=1 Tax=Micromonospora olivasterospora TaxID=1880 RepID=A0A562IG42_MICOL|nr:hypothetical protein [Micromonospora olivasterospora]TWH69862.1 hypothetical protein JD77_04877 [Micromonospora olivasterospora]
MTAATITKFVSPRSVAAHYFRPGEFVNAFAVVLKPREVLPTGADGKSEVLCSAIIFGTEDALEAGRPTHVLADTIVNTSVVYKQLVRTYDQGGVLAGRVGQLGRINPEINLRDRFLTWARAR